MWHLKPGTSLEFPGSSGPLVARLPWKCPWCPLGEQGAEEAAMLAARPTQCSHAGHSHVRAPPVKWWKQSPEQPASHCPHRSDHRRSRDDRPVAQPVPFLNLPYAEGDGWMGFGTVRNKPWHLQLSRFVIWREKPLWIWHCVLFDSRNNHSFPHLGLPLSALQSSVPD